MKKPPSAFTLIELLTVIAIIGILAAIMIPVVASVRDSARQTKCLSHIRETGLALYIFLESNDFYLSTHGEGTDGANIWGNQLAQAGLLEAREVAFCPSIEAGLTDEDLFLTGPWSWRSYGMNMFDNEHGQLIQVFGQSGRRWGINYNAVKEPSRYILLADSIDNRNLPRFRIDSRDANGNGSIHLRHNGRAGTFFLDGHVEAADAQRLGQLGMLGGHGETYADVIKFPTP